MNLSVNIYKSAPFSNVASIVTGKTPAKNNSSYFNGDIPFVTPAELDLDCPVIESKTYLTKHGAERVNMIPKDSIMVSCIGSLGKVGIAGRDLCTNQQINSLIFDQSKVWPKYGYHYCKQLKPYLEGIASSTTLPIVNKTCFSKIEIPLPALEYQKRIAAILDMADALRVKRRQAIAKLDELLQAVFLEMFGDPVTNPKRWDVVKLGKLLQRPATNGAYYPKDSYVNEGGILMVHMSDAFYGSVRLETLKRVIAPADDISKYSLNSNDILVSRRSLNYEGSAKPCLVPNLKEPLIFESSLIRVTPDKNRVLPIYLYTFLNDPRARSKYVFKLVTRSTISGINQGNLLKVEVVVPPIDLQKKFESYVEITNEKLVLMKKHLKGIETIFSSLQQRAFKGEL